MISLAVLIYLLIKMSRVNSKISMYKQQINARKADFTYKEIQQLHSDYAYSIFDEFIRQKWGTDIIGWEIIDNAEFDGVLGTHLTRITFSDGKYTTPRIRFLSGSGETNFTYSFDVIE